MGATLLGSILKRITAPDVTDALFVKRGFDTSDAPAREQLEYSALQLMIGYEFGVEQRDHAGLVARLETLQQEYRGFAYEGAVMGLAVRDFMSPAPGNKATESFLAGPRYDSAPGSKHIFTGYLGIGFALARLPKFLWGRALPDQRKLVDHPSLRWMILDGYGFHLAYFEPHKYVDEQYVARRYPLWEPASYANRVIDQGIGRAMWFVHGGNVERLLAAYARFPESRQADLFAGAGVAAGYAGGIAADALDRLVQGAGRYRPDLAQGAVFALRARVVSDLVTPHNELASQVICGFSAQEASDLAARRILDLPDDATGATYELFRQSIQDHFREPARVTP
jgi:hypothetical protein